ncbi:MAG: hypothetical protein IJK38_04970, partial [Oscillospiraceae bacterium]|nr:hypothetical protein [Oscillospiraceae bacterium]
LGGAMLILNFWLQISSFPLVMQTLHCLGRLVMYIIPCVLILLPIRFLTKVPSYVFRKLLHIVAFSCFTVMLLAAVSWQPVAITSIIIAAAIYPILAMLEKYRWYSRLFVEKEPGEIKKSLLMLFLMFAAVIAIAWGAFKKPHVAAASILMWGVGDAVAALIGIPYGRHQVSFRPINGRKSWEGTIAMLVSSFLVGFCLLRFYFGYPFGSVLLEVVVGATIGAGVEQLSPSEWDTVTVPVAILVVLLMFV